jgi:hypothetical protein
VLRDAQGAVADHDPDPVQPDHGQVGPGLGGQVGEALDRDDLAGQPGQDGGLEPEAGADLQDPLAAGQLQRRHHGGDQAGLGGHLPMRNPDRPVQVGLAGRGRGHEPGPRDGPERGQDPTVSDPLGAQDPDQVLR